MKSKHFLLTLLCLSIGFTSNAQFLKKLKEKAQQAAERTVLKKTDEVVTQKTGQAIDSIATSKPKEKNGEKSNENPNTVGAASAVKSEDNTADLHVQNSVQPLTTQLGGAATFTMAVTNKGPATSNNIITKVVVPSSYNVTNISVTHGTYDKSSTLWNVGTLEPWKRAEMTVLVTVLDDTDLMTTAELMSCSTSDPDSTPGNGIDTNGNGLIIDDKADEDDGDGQNIIVEKSLSGSQGSTNQTNTDNSDHDDNIPSEILPEDDLHGGEIPEYIVEMTTDVKLELRDHNDKQLYFFDFNTMAMRIEYQSKGKNPDPVYFDQYGYIYSGEKGQYYKIHFKSFTNAMVNMAKAFPIPAIGSDAYKKHREVIGTILYNSKQMVIPIENYPILEWAFIYHPSWFDNMNNVAKETISCRGSSNCKRFIVMSGDGTGTYIVFDSKDRLAEISNPDGAKAIYTYEECTVKLPPAKQM